MTERIARRTQAERRQASEQGLLQAAIHIIATRGIGGVTFEAIGKESGFSRGLVTQRFGSKGQLLEAVLAQLHAAHQAQYESGQFVAMNGFDAMLAYTGMCLRQISTSEASRAYFVLLSSTVAELDETQPLYRENHSLVNQRLCEWVVKGQADGSIARDIDPASAAMVVGCLLFGLSMQLLIDRDMALELVCETGLQALRRFLRP